MKIRTKLSAFIITLSVTLIISLSIILIINNKATKETINKQFLTLTKAKANHIETLLNNYEKIH